MCIAVNWITVVPTIRHSVYVLSSSLLFYTLALVFQSICRAFEKLEYITIPHVVGNIFKLAIWHFLVISGIWSCDLNDYNYSESNCQFHT